MRAKIDLRKLPPLNALKGFEATSRRQSVRDAADELCLTHQAVSYQIQVLEEELGVALFSRSGRSLVPTPEGQLLYKYVRTALETLIDGAEIVRRARADAPLRVQTYVTASIRWLAPRLPDYSASHPDTTVLLSTCAYDAAFDDSIADVGLVYCEAPPGPDYRWVPLFDYELVPVCTPAMAAALGPSPSAEALQQLPLVSVYSEARNWEFWFKSAAVEFRAKPAVLADTVAVALEIALSGRGVALVNGPFADEDLAAGRLVRPVDLRVKCPGSWGAICRMDAEENPRIRGFIDWLVAASGAMNTRGAGDPASP